MELKETVAKIIKEELEDSVEGIRFTGPYEGEEFHIIIMLRYEPSDFEKRNIRMRDRVWELGYDIGLSVDYPEQTITV